MAQYVIENSGSLHDTTEQVEGIKLVLVCFNYLLFIFLLGGTDTLKPFSILVPLESQIPLWSDHRRSGGNGVLRFQKGEQTCFTPTY